MNLIIFLERFLGQIMVIYITKTKYILTKKQRILSIYVLYSNILSFELIQFHEWCPFTEQCKHKIPLWRRAIVHCISNINECFLQLTSCMLVSTKNVCFQWKPFSSLDTWMKINFICKNPTFVLMAIGIMM